MKKILKNILITVSIFISFLLASFVVKGKNSAEMKTPSKLTSHLLKNICPDKPNCASSFEDESGDKFVSPSKINTLDHESFKVPQNCSISSSTNNSVHYHCTSSVFGFVDDFEVLFYNEMLYFYSASRVGYSDLGANRKRVELVKELNSL